MTNNRVEYKDGNVLEATKERVTRIFDDFDNIVVSISGGKDSTVLFNLCHREAIKRDRELDVFFLDQEAEYESTITQIKHLLSKDNVNPYWYQVPINLTNATSFDEDQFRAWDEDESWMREKEDCAIKSIEEDYPERFYDFMEWFEGNQDESTAMMVGLRSQESMNRFRSVTKNSGYDDISWTTKTEKDDVYRVYPIYDWEFADIWKFINDNGLEYNDIYDCMYADEGVNETNMRVSNLIHEKSYESIEKLRRYEPDTFSKLTDRIDGVHFASIYTNRKHALDTDELPSSFDSWKDYRDFLLETTPTDKTDRYRNRFENQRDHSKVHKAQCKQILINDWENNVSISNKGIDKELEKVWRDRLEIDN